jgi:hypothetical protein
VIIELLRSGQPVRFRARGGSMWPAVPGGSLIEVTPGLSRVVRRGELVAFERGGRVVVHRVLRVLPRGLELRGDALERSDGIVSPEHLLGSARIVERRRSSVRVPAPRELGVWLRALLRRAKGALHSSGCH